jgi:hypothetical protein
MKKDKAVEVKPEDKPKPLKIIKEYLRYEFTEEELKQKSKDLARSIQLQVAAQEEQKAAAAQFKERIETQVATIGRLSRDINGGWEMRNIDCIVQFHTPTIASKRVIRQDTGELVRECAMEKHELQENLFGADSSQAVAEFFPASTSTEDGASA